MRKNSSLEGHHIRGEWKWMNIKEQESHVEKDTQTGFKDKKRRKRVKERRILNNNKKFNV